MIPDYKSIQRSNSNIVPPSGAKRSETMVQSTANLSTSLSDNQSAAAQSRDPIKIDLTEPDIDKIVLRSRIDGADVSRGLI